MNKSIKQIVMEEIFNSVYDEKTELSSFFSDMDIRGKFDDKKMIAILLLLILRLDNLEKKMG